MVARPPPRACARGVLASPPQTLYQYWIHTELIGKLGPIEWIMNTPSHHRVHHGRNAYCIDHNYGARAGRAAGAGAGAGS